MRDKPVNLNLLTIAFPATAIVSILHRVSGFILFLIIPFFLSMLQNVLAAPTFVCHVSESTTISIYSKIILWALLSALVYHLLAGIRHLIMDAGFAEEKHIARISAYLVFVAVFIISLLLGYRLC